MNLSENITAIMTREVVTVTPDHKLLDIKHIFEKQNFHHHIPVISNNKLSGIISLTDYLYAIKGASLNDSEEVYQKKVKDVMVEKLVTMPSSSTIKDVASELAGGEIHAVLIADNQQLKGIVTSSDLIRYFLKG